METINILLVDDHTLIREGLKLILKKNKNFKIIGEASNGVEAIRYIDKNADKVHVVMLDITMPELDGFEVAKIVRQNHPGIKILALTMHSEESYITKMIDVGVHGYVLKDSNLEDLSAAINTILEGRPYYSSDVSAIMINSLMNKDKKKENNEINNLTDREVQIIDLITEGFKSSEIAEKLKLSTRTIEVHRRNLMKKLDVKNTAELVSFVLKSKLIS
ncbi:MAG: response regulator transcription factor [Flavobacteriales bacterium]|jgi:DNA-binding NarL/FixJ family response regulator|nr:response regulator transcription factor [Flavobacteriales bacterium]MCW8912804.1 response regulator transcription factor [Flavobacteriales bacterium]MCW8938808.1 response regulator transcription factor [Flavobacteriales bacterium]MCW8939221.1 response regulator transcription factor [Flavobacteriales bacterium]MCW8968518.1 response regulator transcription factor [Flavobacteriales bacterium]